MKRASATKVIRDTQLLPLCGKALIEIANNDPINDTLTLSYEGEEHKLRAVVPLLQAIHHAHEHRTQICTILSQSGIAPPDLPVWTYGDEIVY